MIRYNLQSCGSTGYIMLGDAKGVAATGEEGEEDIFSTVSLSAVPLHLVNTFADPALCTSTSVKSLFEKSAEAISLGLQNLKFSSAFLKIVQTKLEAALWEHYLRLKTGENQNVIVNLSSKKIETYVGYPIEKTLELPYVGKVTMIKTKTSLPFVTLFGVPFYIEDCQSADIMVPAWSCKSVTRADIAYFKMKTSRVKLLLVVRKHPSQPSESKVEEGKSEDPGAAGAAVSKEMSEADFSMSIDLCAGTGEHEWEIVPEEALKHRYCICDGTVTSLVPLPDVEAKVTKEVGLQQQRAEKSARTQVESFLKQRKDTQTQGGPKQKRSGGAKAGASKGANSVDALAESLFVDGLPEDPKAKVVALEELVKTQENLDKIIEQAKSKITVPDRLGITKMASEEARTTSSGRAKAMQDALEAAKRAEERGLPAESHESADDSKLGLGLGALRTRAEKKSGGPVVSKKSKEKKIATQSDLAKLGKHLLK